MKYLLSVLGLTLSSVGALIGAPANDAFSSATPITVTASGNSGGTSAGLIVAGTSYRIATAGTTDFTLIGAESNLPGTVFVATGAADGTGTVNTVTGFAGTNVAATRETSEPVHATKGAGNTVWWTWTPTTQGTATITTDGSSFDTVVAVYTGNSVGNLTVVAYNDDVGINTTSSKVSFSVRANQTYRIAVDGYSGGPDAPTGTIKLNVALGTGTYVAQNDYYANRAILAGERTIAFGDTMLATVEIEENARTYYPGTSNSVWWTWTAPRAGRVTITSIMDVNPEYVFDWLQASLDIYDSDAVLIGDLVLPDYFDFSPGFSESETVGITRDVEAGDVLQIRVSSWAATAGAQVTLTVEMSSSGGIPNDRFVKSPRLQGSTDIAFQTNAGATADPTEPAHYAVVTAGSFVPGQLYSIVSEGTTDFTSIGAANNGVGTEFVASGAGGGTGTAVLLRPLSVTSPVFVRANQLVAGSRYVITTLGSTNWADVGAASPVVGLVFTASKPGNGSGFARLYDSGLLEVGKQYRILTSGDSPFTSFGSVSNDPGTIFTATETGEGDGTVLPVEVLNAGAFVVGRIYRIETLDAGIGSPVTDFTAIGASDNSPGTFFKATGIGSGSGTASALVASSSVWWTWVAPSNGYLTINTDNSQFDTVLHVYTGDKLAELVSRASNDDSGGGDLTSRVHFKVSKGTAYRIAVDSVSLDRETGDVQILTEFLPDSPLIKTQVQAQVAYLNDDFAFFTVVHTGAESAYDWQRKVTGSNTWTHYSDGVVISPLIANGETTSMLPVGPISPGMNGDQFRCIITNVGGQVISKSAALTVISLSTYVGGSQSVDISADFEPLPPGATITYYAKGLPSGLTLNRNTGKIEGRLKARPGTYTVTYWAMTTVGKVRTKTASHTTSIYVLPFPAAMTGRFEGLLTDNDDLPSGKVELLVSSVGAFSGKFTYQGKIYSLRDNLTLDDELNPTRGQATFKPSRTSLTLRITVWDDSTMVASLTDTDGLLGEVENGVQLKTYTTLKPAPWANNYTMAFADPDQISGGPVPEGSGYGLVAINYRGDFRIRGKLADGTAITALASSDVSEDGGYRLFIPLYTKKLGYVGGRLPLTPRGVETGLYHLSTSDFFWNKPTNTKDKTYPDGFVAGVDVMMEPWTRPTKSFLLGSLGLVTHGDSQSVGDFGITMDLSTGFGGTISNDGLNPNKLPVWAEMGATSKVTVLSSDPSPGNPTGWRVTVSPTTGVFTGSFTLPDKRRVPFTGVLLQLPDGTTDNTFGRGAFLVPPVKTKPATGYIRSGDLRFIGPAIPDTE